MNEDVSPEDFNALLALYRKNNDVISAADVFLLCKVFLKRRSIEDVEMFIGHRRMRQEFSDYPLEKLIQELPWDRMTGDYESAYSRFKDKSRVTIGLADEGHLDTLKEVIDFLSYLKPNHYFEINEWAHGTFNRTVATDTSRDRVLQFINDYEKAKYDGTLPITVDTYDIEQAKRLIMGFLSFRQRKDDILRSMKAREPCLRDDEAYRKLNPITEEMDPPRLLVVGHPSLVYLLKPGSELPEMIFGEMPVPAEGPLHTFEQDDKLYFAAMVRLEGKYRIGIWDMNAPTRKRQVVLDENGDVHNFDVLKSQGRAQIVTYHDRHLGVYNSNGNLEEIIELPEKLKHDPNSDTIKVVGEQGNRIAYLISNDFIGKVSIDRKFKPVVYSPTEYPSDEEIEDKIQQIIESGSNPQWKEFVSSDFAGMSQEEKRRYFKQEHVLKDFDFGEYKGQKVLYAVSWHGYLFVLDAETLQPVIEKQKVTEKGQITTEIFSDIGGFDAIVGGIFTGDNETLFGINLDPYKVTPLNGPKGDISCVRRLSGKSFIALSYDAEPIVYDSEKQLSYASPVGIVSALVL